MMTLEEEIALYRSHERIARETRNHDMADEFAALAERRERELNT